MTVGVGRVSKIILCRPEELESQAEESGIMQSDGKLVTLYKKAVAVVMPTFFGPSNIPPLEAFALGCPLAISDVPGISEQVEEAGLLFDPNDTDDIAEKIYRIWTDENLRQELIKKGYERVKELNIENYARQWENVIEEAKRKDR